MVERDRESRELARGAVLRKQRYTNLLLQHHSALTAGLVKLYSRLLDGKAWEGAPVDEVNGSPSVHCILERIGVIGAEEEFDEDLDFSDHNERPQLSPIQETANSPAVVKKPAKSTTTTTTTTTQKAAKTKRRSQSQVSSIQTDCSSKSGTIDKTRKSPQHNVQATQLASPSNSEFYSSVFESGSSDTPSTWDSPGFGDELFSAPAPTVEETQAQYERVMDATFPTGHSFSAHHRPTGDADMNAPAPMVFDGGFEMPGADNFVVDATCDMNFYDWDGSNSFGMGTEPGMFMQRNNAWNPGVFA
ncbi:Fluconazole resistance protein 1 [Knufia peltigerae]|uniref:Fluconazole resistance protein 1 n=1 Tax=Knufia peltigerae TaxID=1002370 RepID=A0AA39CRT7_9EURO|nr:Fluconazole resistance protein 1 [Knufia peltigerae]